MGILKAITGAIGGGLADSWLEVIEADNMTDTTVMTGGVRVRRDKRSSNVRGSADVISNGSVIHVYPNQMMILLDNGRIVDYCAEEGTYEVYLSSTPSMFNGELKASVKETFGRIKFGGTPSSKQQVVFINLQEIKGIKFGTRNPVNYFDNFYNAELFLRAHGTYSIKITDPLKFFTEAIPRNARHVDINDINTQYLSEFLSALQSAINQMSVDGVRISTLSSQSMKLGKYMADVLDSDWNESRGMEIQSVGIASISYDEESTKLINIRNKGAMLSDPTIREGYIQGAVAGGIEAAGSNKAGAGQAFMGVGLGMNAGNFMASASANNAAQAAQRQQAQPNGWVCSCGAQNQGNFCATCGKPKATSWRCSCGAENSGNFCSECGKPKPAGGGWNCSCGKQGNTGNFCAECGKPKA